MSTVGAGGGGGAGEDAASAAVEVVAGAGAGAVVFAADAVAGGAFGGSASAVTPVMTTEAIVTNN